jgi:hypothetical protein
MWLKCRNEHYNLVYDWPVLCNSKNNASCGFTDQRSDGCNSEICSQGTEGVAEIAVSRCMTVSLAPR